MMWVILSTRIPCGQGGEWECRGDDEAVHVASPIALVTSLVKRERIYRAKGK